MVWDGGKTKPEIMKNSADHDQAQSVPKISVNICPVLRWKLLSTNKLKFAKRLSPAMGHKNVQNAIRSVRNKNLKTQNAKSETILND